MLKSLFYTGVGSALFAMEKFKEEVEKLEDKTNLSKQDLKSLIESFEEKGKEQEKESKEKLKSILKEIIDEMGIATKEDLQKLKEDLK
jgi:polyhydroxyalkanoate synthesis regulator phasin